MPPLPTRRSMRYFSCRVWPISSMARRGPEVTPGARWVQRGSRATPKDVYGADGFESPVPGMPSRKRAQAAPFVTSALERVERFVPARGFPIFHELAPEVFFGGE